MGKVQVRELTTVERDHLERGVRSNDAFVMRRSQMILLSADDQLSTEAIGKRVGRSGQMVRNVLHGFNAVGLAILQPQSTARPDDQRAFDDTARARLAAIVQQSPRAYGYATSLWSLERLAAVSYREGLTTHQVHLDTVSETLKQMGINWQRARQHITSPDPHYTVKKSGAIG